MRRGQAGLLLFVALGVAASAGETAREASETLERASWMHQRLHAIRDGGTPSRAATAMALRLERERGPAGRSERALELTRRHLASRSDEQNAWAMEHAIALDLERLRAPTAPRSHREQFILAAIEDNLVRTVTQPILCCLCGSAARCDDGVFCNGAETCNDAVCGGGPLPTCSDGDTCTDDFCDLGADACDSTPLPPPSEVTQLDVGRVGGSTVADLSWSAVSGSVTYNLYRGEMVDLFDLSCYRESVATTAFSDDGSVSPTGIHVFLVSAEECGESSLGDDSYGPRPTPAGVCP